MAFSPNQAPHVTAKNPGQVAPGAGGNPLLAGLSLPTSPASFRGYQPFPSPSPPTLTPRAGAHQFL